MKRSNALDADGLIEFAEGAVVTLLRANIIAGGEGVRGVETDTQPIAFLGGVDDLTDLFEAVADIGSLAGGDFECYLSPVTGTSLVNDIQRLRDGFDSGQFAGSDVRTGMRDEILYAQYFASFELVDECLD